MFAYAGDLPEISALDNYAPSTITRVYASGGELVGEFAVQRRLIVGYDDIAPQLRQAIIAAEDGDFNSHFGLSISHIIAAVSSRHSSRGGRRGGRAEDVPPGRRQHAHAAARHGRCSRRRSASASATSASSGRSRKRSSRFRSRSATQRTRSSPSTPTTCSSATAPTASRRVRACTSASRPRMCRSTRPPCSPASSSRPARQSPFVNVGAATGRRNYALQRMADEGFITQAEADAAKKRPIVVERTAAAGQVERPVLPRRGAPAPRAGIRREGAVRRRAVGHVHARRARCRTSRTAPSTAACAP